MLWTAYAWVQEYLYVWDAAIKVYHVPWSSFVIYTLYVIPAYYIATNCIVQWLQLGKQPKRKVLVCSLFLCQFFMQFHFKLDAKQAVMAASFQQQQQQQQQQATPEEQEQ